MTVAKKKGQIKYWRGNRGEKPCNIPQDQKKNILSYLYYRSAGTVYLLYQDGGTRGPVLLSNNLIGSYKSLFFWVFPLFLYPLMFRNEAPLGNSKAIHLSHYFVILWRIYYDIKKFIITLRYLWVTN